MTKQAIDALRDAASRASGRFNCTNQAVRALVVDLGYVVVDGYEFGRPLLRITNSGVEAVS